MNIDYSTILLVAFAISVCVSIRVYLSKIKKGEDRFHTFMISLVLTIPVFLVFHSIIPVYVAIETNDDIKYKHEYYHIGNNFFSEMFGRYIYNGTNENLYLYPAAYGHGNYENANTIILSPGNTFSWDKIGGILQKPSYISKMAGIRYYLLDEDMYQEELRRCH